MNENLEENDANNIINEAKRASEWAFRRETENKRNKLARDEREKVELENRLGKKKKNRRFRRRRTRAENNNSSAMNEPNDSNNNEIVLNVLEAKVKNISSRELTEHETKLLELGPKFCLVEHDVDRARIQKDLNDK